MSSKPAVPNPRAEDQYRSVGHLVPGRTERINNLHYFRFIYFRIWKMFYFEKLPDSLRHSWRTSRRCARSRGYRLPLKWNPGASKMSKQQKSLESIFGKGKRHVDMFQTLAGILEETESEPAFSKLVHDHLSSLLKEFERYFPNTKHPRTAREWIHFSTNHHACVRRSTAGDRKWRRPQKYVRDNNSAGVLDGSHGWIPWDRHNSTENSPPTCVKWGFLQWRRPKKNYEVDWT